MKRILLASVALLGFGATLCRATDPVYQNFGIVTNEPVIDATVFYNQGTFTNFQTTLPYDTQNTLFFTNRGVLSGACGFRFDTATPTNRHAATTFNNHGIISATDLGTLFTGIAINSGGGFATTGGTGLASYLLVSATNMINDGTMSVGSVGLLRATAKNMDLSRGALVAGSLNNDSTNAFNLGLGIFDLNSLSSGRGFLFNNGFLNPQGVLDLYWGVDNGGTMDLSGTLTLQNGAAPSPRTPGETVQYPGGTIETGFTLPITLAQFNAYYLHSPFEPQPEFSYSVGTNHYVNVIFVKTNFDDSNTIANVRFSRSYDLENVGLVPDDELGSRVNDIVQFGIPTEDVITGATVTNAFYLLDTGNFYSSLRLVTNIESPNSISKPVSFEITTATPFEWAAADFDPFLGTNTAPFLPQYLYKPGDMKDKKVPYISSSYGAQVGRNPENGDGLTSSTNNFYLVNAVQTLADPTNQAGRIEITADNLNMTQARIRSEGLLSITAKHMQGSGAFGLDAGIVNADLASTNGLLTVSNVVPQHFKRVRGDIYAWSGDWDNIETNAIDVTTGLAVTNKVHYHALVIDNSLKADFIPTIRHLSLRATNTVVVKDGMRAVRSTLFDTVNLTLNNTLTLAETAGGIHLTNVPKLQNLFIDTNGALIAEQDLHFGYDTAKGINSVTNLGTFIGSAVLVRAASIENAGTIYGTNGGSITLQGGAVQFNSVINVLPPTNGLVLADRDITISANSLTLAGVNISAGQGGGAGQLNLNLTNLLTDNVAATAGTNNVITNFVQVTDGFIMNRIPAAGSLYGTEFKTIATGFNVPVHVWAGNDLGASSAGYANNVVVGRLVLDRKDTHAALHFAGAGAQSAMYVDFLELDDLSFTDYRNGLIIDPNLTIYFASSTVDPEKLETVYPGRLVWVRDVAGPSSTVVVPRTDGTTCLMNRALAESTDIDSDQDGTANAYDSFPLDNISDPSLSIPCPGDASSASLALKAQTGNLISTLDLWTVGPGKVTPNLGVQKLVVGKTYTLTATANVGAIFTGWSGLTNTTKSSVSIALRSTNLLLKATFIPNPFLPLKGAFNGLFTVSNNVQQASSGLVNLTLTDKGAFSGRISMSGTAYALSGQFNLDGVADVQVKRTGKTTLSLHLQLDVGLDTRLIHGTVTDGTWTADLSADLAPVRTAAAQAGTYTVALPGSADASTAPGGNGYATVTVAKTGSLTISGKLGDGAIFSQIVPVSTAGRWPLYVSLLAGKESVVGWMQISDDVSELSGNATWINTAAKRTYYAAGYTNALTAIGSRYVAPAAKTTGLSLVNPAVTLSGGNLTVPLTQAITVDPIHLTATTTNRSVVLTLNAKTGTFTGSVVSPVTHKTVATSGILLQKQNMVSGYFLGTNQSGGLLLQNQ